MRIFSFQQPECVSCMFGFYTENPHADAARIGSRQGVTFRMHGLVLARANAFKLLLTANRHLRQLLRSIKDSWLQGHLTGSMGIRSLVATRMCHRVVWDKVPMSNDSEI